MKFNRINIIVLVGFIILGAAFINAGFYYAEAQQGAAVEGFTNEDKDKTFQWLQFELYFRASNIGDGNNFLNNIEIERTRHVLKDFPVKVKAQLWCIHPVHGEIYLLEGAYVFKERTSAQVVKNWLKNNLPLSSIDYGEFYLTENSHHWDNPQHDIIIEHRTYGDKTQFDKVWLECNT